MDQRLWDRFAVPGVRVASDRLRCEAVRPNGGALSERPIPGPSRLRFKSYGGQLVRVRQVFQGWTR